MWNRGNSVENRIYVVTNKRDACATIRKKLTEILFGELKLFVNGEEEYAYNLSTHPPTTIDHFVLLVALKRRTKSFSDKRVPSYDLAIE